jgi:hypothetical protein
MRPIAAQHLMEMITRDILSNGATVATGALTMNHSGGEGER